MSDRKKKRDLAGTVGLLLVLTGAPLAAWGGHQLGPAPVSAVENICVGGLSVPLGRREPVLGRPSDGGFFPERASHRDPCGEWGADVGPGVERLLWASTGDGGFIAVYRSSLSADRLGAGVARALVESGYRETPGSALLRKRNARVPLTAMERKNAWVLLVPLPGLGREDEEMLVAMGIPWGHREGEQRR